MRCTFKPRIVALFGSAVVYGQERANMEVLSQLQARGCDVLCIIRGEKWNVAIPAALNERNLRWVRAPYVEQRASGRALHFFVRNPVAFIWGNLRIVPILVRFRPTHVYAFNQLYVLSFIVALGIARKPIVFRAGDEPTLHNMMFRWAWWFLRARTSRFVANSAYVQRSLQRHGVALDRIRVIYNKAPSRPKPRQGFGVDLPGDARVLGFIGQIAEHKGIHVLIDAFGQIASDYPNAHLLVAGRIIPVWRGHAWARGLRDRVQGDPLLRDRILFLGDVEDIYGLLARCELLVVPSLFADPSPNVVMEAKSVGRPAIVFANGGLPELIEHGVDGHLCRQPTVADLAKALRLYLDDPALSERQGRAALLSQDKFELSSFGDKWFSMFLDAPCRGLAVGDGQAGELAADR